MYEGRSKRARLVLAVCVLALPIALSLLAFALQTAPPAWVEYLAFSILVPLVIQLLRLLAAKGVKVEIRGWVMRGLAFLISVATVWLMGGFATILLPVYGGDPVAFVGALLAFFVAAYSPVELMYRLIIKPIEGAAPKQLSV